MAKEYVLTLTAANRIGILAAVSNAIAELGGDVREINVSVMRKFFTIMLSADFPDERSPDVIVDHLRDMGRPYGLTVVLSDPDAVELPDVPGNASTYFLTLTGQSQPGTMRHIASRMKQEGVDVADLYAVKEDDGSFRMVLELSVPPDVNADGLAAAMESLNHNTDITAELQTEAEFRKTAAELPLKTLL